MAEFTRRPLGLLDGIYRFVGGLKGVNRLNLSEDITVVHDVSRQAEKSGMGGYFGQAMWQDSGAINGLSYPQLTRYGDFESALGIDNEAYEVYVTGMSAYVASADKANLTQIGWVLFNNLVPLNLLHMGTAQQIVDPLAWFTTAEIPTLCGYGTCSYHPPQPIRLAPNSRLMMHIETGALITVHWTWTLWIGAAGSSPPGLA